MVPEKKITPEEIKYLLSSHYQGTPYDPYARSADPNQKGIFWPIGVNRTDLMALLQLPAGLPRSTAVRWNGCLLPPTLLIPWPPSTPM